MFAGKLHLMRLAISRTQNHIASGRILLCLFRDLDYFVDIAGFTAWSSVREPAQVFTLLEQIYGSFDALSKRRGVFKVETIGDCYGKILEDRAVVELDFAGIFVSFRVRSYFCPLNSRRFRLATTERGPCCRHGSFCQ